MSVCWIGREEEDMAAKTKTDQYKQKLHLTHPLHTCQENPNLPCDACKKK